MREVLDTDPHHMGALEILAKAQWQAGEIDDLLGTLRKLIELNPYEPGYQILQAGALQSLGRCGEAVKAYGRALELGLGNRKELEEMIGDLQSWQATLIKDLLNEDPVFKAAYRQDPDRACRERGFELEAIRQTKELWIQDRQARAAVFARPS